MIITLKKNTSKCDIIELREYIKCLGLSISDASSKETTLFGLIGDTSNLTKDDFLKFDCVDNVIRISSLSNKTKTSYLKNSKILIVGLGLIGGSYAKALHKLGYIVRAIDINQDSIDYALSKGFIDNENLSDEELISSSDFIICATYPLDTVEWIKNNNKLFKENVIITDTSGVKKAIVEKINSSLTKGEFIASHPMAGREVSGVRNSISNLFDGANFIITPLNNSDYAIEVLEELGTLLNFKYVEKITIDEHDDLIGFLSQLTHAIAVSLMNSQETEHLIRYTGDSFRDLTRIAKINEKLWSELFLLNKDTLINKIDLFVNSLNELRKYLYQEDIEGLKRFFIVATNARKKFDE